MDTVLVRSWIEEFERAARERRADRLDKEKLDWQRRLERERDHERHVIDEQRDRDEWAEFEAALAPPERIDAFKVQLDTYDAKTVEALIENREALDIVRRKIERMLDEAYVLPDGRRVFKTEDGQRVFDEHGQEVPREIIDPNEIDNRKPRYGSFRAAQEERERLEAEQRQLLDYQRRLDEARERLDRGEITNGELNRLQADIASHMPEAIRHKLDQKAAGPAQTQRADQASAGPTVSAAPITGGQSPTAKPALSAAVSADADAFLRQSGLGPTPSAPKM